MSAIADAFFILPRLLRGDLTAMLARAEERGKRGADRGLTSPSRKTRCAPSRADSPDAPSSNGKTTDSDSVN